MALTTFAILLLTPDMALAKGQFKARARENYEQIKINIGQASHQFESFSHTINLWYEDPFNFAVGLATGPYGMAYRESPGQEQRPPELGQSIKLINQGLELKYWYLAGAFVRTGAYYQQFNSQGSAGRDEGTAWLIGAGYEWDLSGIGLALEADYRASRLNRLQWDVNASMVAIGVHFYDWF